MFSMFGRIVKIQMLPAQHRASVSFVHKEDAVNAMISLDQTEYRGKVLTVKLTGPKTDV